MDKVCMGMKHTQQRISKLVAQGQWGVVGVGANPPFTYTVGLHKHSLPELIIVGMDPSIAMVILNACAQMMIEKTAAFPHMTVVTELANYPVTIIDCSEANKQEYAIQAYNFYRHWNFDLQQIVFTDKNSRLPWEEGCRDDLVKWQPVLGNVLH